MKMIRVANLRTLLKEVSDPFVTPCSSGPRWITLFNGETSTHWVNQKITQGIMIPFVCWIALSNL